MIFGEKGTTEIMVENAKVEDFLKTIIDDVRYRLQQEEDK